MITGSPIGLAASCRIVYSMEATVSAKSIPKGAPGEDRSGRSRSDRRLLGRCDASGRRGGPPHREERAPRSDEERRRPRAQCARRLRSTPPCHRRSGRGRTRRLRVPRTQGALLPDVRSPGRTAAGSRHRRDRGTERDPVVVLPRAEGPLSGQADRSGGPGGRHQRRAPTRARDRLRRLSRNGHRGARRHPPPRGHALLHRRAVGRDLDPLHRAERRDDRWRPQESGRARHPRRHLDQADGQCRVQPDQRAHPRNHGRDLPAPTDPRRGRQADGRDARHRRQVGQHP